MHCIDLERIGVHQHQPEIGFVAAHDRCLQTQRSIRSLGIELSNHAVLPGGELLGRHLSENAAIPAVIEMAAMPSPGCGIERDLDGLWRMSRTVHAADGLDQ